MTKKDSQEQKIPPDVRGMNKTVRAMYNSSAMGFVYNDLIRSYHGLKKYSKQADKSVYRSTKQIQEQLDWMDIRDIRRYVKKLVDDGWIKVTKRAHGCMYILPGNKLPDYASVASKISLGVLSKMAENDQKNGGSAPENNTHNSEKSGVSHPSQDSKNGGSAPENSPIIKCNNNQVNLCRDSKESLQMASQRKQACTTPPLAGAQQAACLTAMPAELSSLQVASASLGRVIRRKKLTSYSDVQRDATHPEPPQLRRTPPKQTKESRGAEHPTITQKPQSRELPASHPDVKLLVPLLKQVHAKLVSNDSRRQWTRSANVLLGRTPHSDGAYSFRSAQEAALYLQMVLSFPWAGYEALTAFSFKFNNLRAIIDWKSTKILRAMNLFLNRPVDSRPREIKMWDKNKYLQMVCPQYDIPWPVEAKANVRKDGVNYFRGMRVDSEMGLLFNKVRDIMRKDAEKMKGEQ